MLLHPYLLLLVYVCDPLIGARKEAVLIIKLHHGFVPGIQLAVAHVISVNKTPLTPAGILIHREAGTQQNRMVTYSEQSKFHTICIQEFEHAVKGHGTNQ